MEEKKLFCQSCGMPMADAKDFGTCEDGSRCEDYCCYCYENGAFAQDCTMEEMIEFCLNVNDETGAMGSRADAKKMMEEWFPTLKRWQKK